MRDFALEPGRLTNGSIASSLSIGLQVDTLDPLDRLTIQTANSRYEIVVICPSTGSVLLRGGQLSAHFTPGHVAGCPSDEGQLKPFGIYVGLPLALLCGRDGILTSSVTAIEHTPASGPH